MKEFQRNIQDADLCFNLVNKLQLNMKEAYMNSLSRSLCRSLSHKLCGWPVNSTWNQSEFSEEGALALNNIYKEK